jgi:hypothetical protein
LGGVKIGKFGNPRGLRRPEIMRKFDSMDEFFFPLGQDYNYYEGLNKLGAVLRDRISMA